MLRTSEFAWGHAESGRKSVCVRDSAAASLDEANFCLWTFKYEYRNTACLKHDKSVINCCASLFNLTASFDFTVSDIIFFFIWPRDNGSLWNFQKRIAIFFFRYRASKRNKKYDWGVFRSGYLLRISCKPFVCNAVTFSFIFIKFAMGLIKDCWTSTVFFYLFCSRWICFILRKRFSVVLFSFRWFVIAWPPNATRQPKYCQEMYGLLWH